MLSPIHNSRIAILNSIIIYIKYGRPELYQELLTKLAEKEDLYPFLKDCCLIFPQEYLQSSLLNFQGTISDLNTALENFQKMISQKQLAQRLLSRYANEFLGCILNPDLSLQEPEPDFPEFNLKINGKIDYTPYLNELEAVIGNKDRN